MQVEERGVSRPSIYGPNPACYLFLLIFIAHELKTVFTFLNVWKKIKRRIKFHVTWKLYGVQNPLFRNKVLLELSHAVIYVLCMAAVITTSSEFVVVTETIKLKKPKICIIIWLFTEDVYWLLTSAIAVAQERVDGNLQR